MDVVGHNDVAADEDAPGGGFGEAAKSLMKGGLGENGHAVMRTEGEEIEELVGQDSVEAGEARRMHGERRRS